MGESAPAVDAQVRKQVRELLSEDPGVREQTLNSLTSHAAEAAAALIELIRRKAGHPEVLMPLSDALVGLGKSSVDVIMQALKEPARYERPEELNVVNSLVDALNELGEKRCAVVLQDVLRKLAVLEKEKKGETLPWDPELTRVKIHETLAEWGDLSGLKDLVRMLGDGRGRVRNGVVASLAKIGDRSVLVPLLRLHAIEAPVSSSGEQDIKEAFREIVRREGIAKDDPIFAKVTDEERATLERLFPSKLKVGNGNGQAAPKPAPSK
jgi:HEAT repeat protein